MVTLAAFSLLSHFSRLQVFGLSDAEVDHLMSIAIGIFPSVNTTAAGLRSENAYTRWWHQRRKTATFWSQLSKDLDNISDVAEQAGWQKAPARADGSGPRAQQLVVGPLVV